MKVCFFLMGFQKNGGIGRVTSILLNNLSKDTKYELFALSYSDLKKENLYLIDESVKTEFLFDNHCSVTRSFTKGILRKLSTYLRINKIDLLVVCGGMLILPALISGKITGTKVWFWDHTSPYAKTDYRFQRICRFLGMHFSDKNLLLTKEAKAYYDARTKNAKNYIMYNPVDDNAGKSKVYLTESNKIISVGRLDYQKNFDGLIEVAKDVLLSHCNWVWDIYGEGPDRQKLQGIIDSYKLSNQVRLMGQVSDLYDRYKDYSFIVMTSRYEGFPMTLLEAAANRLPLVSYDIKTGPNEIIDDNINGFLVPFENRNMMKEKIENLISNSELREKMSIESKNRSENFSVFNTIMKWKKLFDKEMNCK